MDIFSRTESLLGEEFLERAAQTRIILFGVGGVGSWCAECLVRTGFRNLTLVDFDTVAESNINRQLPALISTLGRKKVEVMKEHLLDINPDADITAVDRKYDASTAEDFHLEEYDFVVDAIDIIDDKAHLILAACDARTRLISSMGAAMKCDPLKVECAEFRNVKGCRLAAALRQKFKKLQRWPSRKFKCIFSQEYFPPSAEKGSLMQVTATFGLALAAQITRHLSHNE